ncbi:hypothetical protein [Paenibacillus odorifer]|uniref:hypothetical protein n=1 Tax=Paenibacillus odorifer TaxID=189426 RepID=UPI00096FAF6F|nr:hypothetical protein [Paenibacillus odorifer]OMD78255.1 hypothetical protein BSK50_10935 [Paenibacillus odorifer]
MIPYNINVEMNLHQDWNGFLIAQFNQYPFVKESEYKDILSNDIGYVYFNWTNRLISPAKRKVHYSKQFKCPSKLKKGLNKLIRKIQNGDNLIPHQTRNLKKLRFNDGLFNDWGIQHLHISSEIEEDGFVKRAGDVLYVLLNDKNAYLIQIADHMSFAKQEMIKILHANWPEVIEPYRINALSVEPKLTDNEVGLFRKHGISAAIELEKGVIYSPIGGGITTARTSSKATMQCHKYHNWMSRIEIHIRDNISNYIPTIKEKLGYQPKLLKFKLIIDSSLNVYVIESNSKFKIDFGKLNQ